MKSSTVLDDDDPGLFSLTPVLAFLSEKLWFYMGVWWTWGQAYQSLIVPAVLVLAALFWLRAFLKSLLTVSSALYGLPTEAIWQHLGVELPPTTKQH